MKYKIRYTLMAFMLCGVLGVDLAYEYQKSAPIAAVTPHPVVHSIKHLIAPASPTIATSTATTTASTATSTAPTTIEASSTVATSSTPFQSTARTATSTNRSRKNLLQPTSNEIRF